MRRKEAPGQIPLWLTRAEVRHLGLDDRDRLEDLVRLVERGDRACALVLVRTPPAFFTVARDRDRFVVVVGAPRAFFAATTRKERRRGVELSRCQTLVAAFARSGSKGNEARVPASAMRVSTGCAL